MKKRVLSLILALVMLLSLGALFASCGAAKGEITLTGKIELDIKEYNLFYAESESGVGIYKKSIDYFASEMKEITGKSFVARSTQKAEPEEDEPAILVGDTGFKESKKAKRSIKGDGFAIHVYDNRVAIVGSNELLTIYALQYFTDTLLEEHDGRMLLNIPEKTTANALPMVVLADSEEGSVPVVYDADCYEDTAHPVNELMKVYASHDLRDAPVVAAAEVSKYVQSVITSRKANILIKKDNEDAAGSELLIGYTNRPASVDCLNELSVYEYGFFVRNGQMVLSAWNDAQMFTANTMFSELLKLATETDKKGNVTIAFPEGFVCKGKSNGDFVTDFPQPEGIQLYNTMDTSEGTLQYVYKGEGVSPESYQAYVSKLKSNGYSVISENEIRDSLFTTLVNSTQGIMLYVSYNAFAHEEEFAHDYDPLIRVISASTENVSVPDASVLTKPTEYKKVTNTAVTALEIIGNLVGMCYIITLEDGSFVIFDGGASGTMTISGQSWTMAEKIWYTLNARYEMIHDHKPTAEEPIRIAAWVVTHSHSDHYGAPINFWAKYGSERTLEMDYLIGNYPSATAIHHVSGSDSLSMSNAQDMAKQNGFTFLKVHAGQKYYFANLEMEVLTTYEDLAPERIKNTNDTCTVLRFSMQATQDGIKDGVATNVGEPYTMVWTGDANRQQSRYLCAMYGDYMASNMVQVAHHGNVGSETDFYNCVKAEVVWFPHNMNSFRSYVRLANKGAGFNYAVDYNLVHESEYTKYVFVSGGDGQKNQAARGVDLTVEFGDDGLPQFDWEYNEDDEVVTVGLYYLDIVAYKGGDNILTKYPLLSVSTNDIESVVSSAYKQTKNFK